jgi:hypothetical protein
MGAYAREVSAGRAVAAKRRVTVATADVSVMVSVEIHLPLNQLVGGPIHLAPI